MRDNDIPRKRERTLAAGKVYQWDDSQASAGIFRAGLTALTLDTLIGGIQQFRFDVNDEVFIPAMQFSHAMLEGCNISPHIHLINQNSTIVSPQTVMNIAFEFEWSWVNIGDEIPAVTNSPATFDIGGLPALHHAVYSFGEITPNAVQGNISSCFICRIKRVAAVSDPYNTNDIFTFGLDLHFQKNTLGSQQKFIK